MTVQKKRGRPFPGYSMHLSGYKVPDEQIEEYLMEFFYDDQIGGIGYKKWRELLVNIFDIKINKKKVYRLCKKLKILQTRRKKPKHPRKLARNRKVNAPNQLWQIDIKYAPIANSGHFIFICSAIDVFDRRIVGYYRGKTCKAKDVTQMLTKAIIRRKIHFKNEVGENKLIIRSDNGPQFVSHKFGDFCEHHKIFHERIPNRTPDMNAYIESFHSCIQRECLDRHPFEFYEEGYYHIDKYMNFYNDTRPHGSLNYPSPKKYHELFVIGECGDQVVSL